MRKRWKCLVLILLVVAVPSLAQENPLTAFEAKEKLTHYWEQLAELEQGIDQHLGEMNSLFEQARTRNSKYSLKSETQGIVRVTRTDGYGIPRLYIYNKLMFRLQLENSNMQVTIFLQNDLGSGEWDTFDTSDYWVAASALWGKQKLDLTIGSFYSSNSPLTLGRAVRKKDLWPETRYSFRGIQAASSFPNLSGRVFFSRLKAGGGESYDRYAIFNRWDTSIGGLKSGFTFFRVFDDLASAQAQEPAYSSTTVGYHFDNRSLPFARLMEAQGEAIFAFQDRDAKSGPDPTVEYAARIEGVLKTKLPLYYNYYAISSEYPVDFSAVHTIDPDYLYRFEDNPWQPDYITNLQRLSLTTGTIPVLGLGNLAMEFNVAGEVEPKRSYARKTFGYTGGRFYRYVTVPFPFVEGARLELAGGQYWTRRPGRDMIDIAENLGELSLTQAMGDTIIIAGYQQLNLKGEAKGQEFSEKIQKPFAEIHWGLGSSNWTWRTEFFRGDQNKNYSKLTARFPVGAGGSISCRYEENCGDEDNSNLLIEYNSSF